MYFQICRYVTFNKKMLTITPNRTFKNHLQYYIATDNRRALRYEHSTSCSYLYSIHHNYLYVGRYVRITRAVQHVQNMNKRRCQLSRRAPLQGEQSGMARGLWIIVGWLAVERERTDSTSLTC